MRLLFAFATFIPFLVFSSCSGGKDIPDVSDIKADVEIHRFDKDFFSLDTNQLDQSLSALGKKYPAFLPLYFEYFSPVDFIVRQQEISYQQAVKDYYRNIKPLYDSVEKKFPDTRGFEKELEKNLRYVKHYFPRFTMPVVLTTVESLNPENPMEIYGTTYYHDTLIISLQMFLGKNFSVYNPAEYPDYLRRRFQPEFIVPNSMRAITMEIYPGQTETGSLVEQMIEKGKQWFLLKKFLPETPDSLITGFNSQQTEWCSKNEGNIWAYMNQNENLYSSDQATLQTYIGEAPFTATLPHGNSGQGAPGNIGSWVGMRIVETYAAANEDVDLEELLKTPARKIFQEAKYRPK